MRPLALLLPLALALPPSSWGAGGDLDKQKTEYEGIPEQTNSIYDRGRKDFLEAAAREALGEAGHRGGAPKKKREDVRRSNSESDDGPAGPASKAKAKEEDQASPLNPGNAEGYRSEQGLNNHPRGRKSSAGADEKAPANHPGWLEEGVAEGSLGVPTLTVPRVPKIGAGEDAEMEKKQSQAEAAALQHEAAVEARTTGRISPKTARRAGDALLRAGQPAEAEKFYKAVLRSEPQDSDSLSALALVQAQQGRGDEAKASAKKALALDPESKLAKLVAGHTDSLARADGAAGRMGKLGLTGFDGGLTSQDGGPGGRGAKDERPAPVPLYDLARPLTETQQMVVKALHLLAIGDSKGALLLVTQAVDRDPGDARALVVRAEIGNALGNHKGAIADATKAVQLEPNDPPLDARALRARSYARFSAGDLEGALADANTAVRLEPGNGLGYLYRAMALEKLGRKDEARGDAEKALELDAALEPLARPLLDKLAPPPPSLTFLQDVRLRRYGIPLLALLLILAGLTGTEAGRRLTTTAAKAFAGARSGHTPKPAGVELKAGDFLGGNYRIVREIGRGGMGVVYEAQDETLQRRVAIKRMQGADSGDTQRFLREARLVAQLKHPHLAEIYNVVVAGEPFLVFEFVQGQGLDQLLRGGALPAGQARKLVGEICQALEYAHGRNIIHRDLKPSNVLLSADGAAKVMDFGIAHQSRGVSTMTQTAVCGTPAYMAPEQGFGTVSKASDLYALGVMCYELLSGRRPFDQADFAQAKLESRFAPVTKHAPSLPRGLDAFFAKALAADASKRFASAAEFRHAFEKALDGTPAHV
jgi:tetratricopeptide (TPR) repeat protein/predicted Ser/Thr protein kinase